MAGIVNKRPPLPDETPLERLAKPFQEFAKLEASDGILLIACALAALIWANSPWAESYFGLWHTKLTFGFAGQQLSEELHFWINDGLMALFFLRAAKRFSTSFVAPTRRAIPSRLARQEAPRLVCLRRMPGCGIADAPLRACSRPVDQTRHHANFRARQCRSHFQRWRRLHSLVSPISAGVICGQGLGKPIGIIGFSWPAVRLRREACPTVLSGVR